MNYTIQYLRIGRSSRLRWLVALLLVLLFSSSSHGQDGVHSGRKALGEANLPWYDTNSDAPMPIELKAAEEFEQVDLDGLPRKIKKAKPATNPTAPPAPGGRAGTGVGAGLNALAWVLIGAVVAVLLGLLLWAFLRLESDDEGTGESVVRRKATAEQIELLPFKVNQRDGDFRSLTEEAYRKGEMREAVMYLFSHVLLSLDHKSIVRLRKGKTNRQYLRELRGHGGMSGYFKRVMVTFEDAFFGDRVPEPAEFESVWQDLDGFMRDVDQHSEVALP